MDSHNVRSACSHARLGPRRRPGTAQVSSKCSVSPAASPCTPGSGRQGATGTTTPASSEARNLPAMSAHASRSSGAGYSSERPVLASLTLRYRHGTLGVPAPRRPPNGRTSRHARTSPDPPNSWPPAGRQLATLVAAPSVSRLWRATRELYIPRHRTRRQTRMAKLGQRIRLWGRRSRSPIDASAGPWVPTGWSQHAAVNDGWSMRREVNARARTRAATGALSGSPRRWQC
jgi:hypothetical protein